jgi:biopolymer transport protein ExbD
MRRRIRRRPETPVELNVIPLIDVVFFLLVFYVITTSFVQEAAVTVDRPGSAGATAVTGGFVAVAVTKGGVIQVGERVVDLLALSEVVAAARRDQACDRVVVVADRDVTTGLLLQVLDGCRAGGAGDVQVAATAP